MVGGGWPLISRKSNKKIRYHSRLEVHIICTYLYILRGDYDNACYYSSLVNGLTTSIYAHLPIHTYVLTWHTPTVFQTLP